MTDKLFGWVPESAMDKPQQVIHHDILDQMPAFKIQGNYKADKERYPLWSARKHTYIKQLSGSCVGAGGGNMLMTLLGVEQLNGDPDEWNLFWWPYTYGESREIAGMRGKGEGSFGSAWAKAVTTEGTVRASEKGLPKFRDREGWLELTQSIEMEWSAGDAIKPNWNEIGRQHPVKTMSPVKTTDDAAAALVNGYPLTIASMFGTRTIRAKGTPKVNIAEYDDQWPHQQSIDEVWFHPELGPLFHVLNQWGPNAHPAPVSGEPAGGYYVEEKTLTRVLREQYTECYAGSQYEGYPAQEVPYDELW